MNRRIASLVAAVAVLAWLVAEFTDIPPHQHLTDLPVYENAAGRIADGQLPYRDFDFEYPPLAAGLVTLARLLPLSYRTGFSILMLVALIAAALSAVAIARELGMSHRRGLAAGLTVALVPLLLGDFVATRFDLAVTALVGWTIWAAVARRWRLAWGLLAAATALKLVPLVLAPLLYIWHRRHRGDRSASAGLGAAIGAAALTFLPFAIASPGGVWRLFRYHLDRPLEIESLGGAYLLGLHGLTGGPLRVETTFGSQNLIGTGPQVIAAISTALVAVGIAAAAISVGVLLRHGRGRDPQWDARIVVTGMAATLAVVVGAGKVLSPQFLVWLLPATLLVTGRYGRHAFGLTAAAMVGTQFYFPGDYWDLVTLRGPEIAMLVVRDALLVALVACAWPRPRIGQTAMATGDGPFMQMGRVSPER